VFHQHRAADDVHVQVENYALDVKNDEEKVVMGYDSELPFVGLAFKLEACQQGGPTGARTNWRTNSGWMAAALLPAVGLGHLEVLPL
jgi:hypothetical protein